MNIAKFFKWYFGFFTLCWGSSSVDSCSSVSSFELAEDFFNNTRPVKSKYYSSDERPLARTAYRQFKLLKEHDGSFSLQLYRTRMVRYYKPDENGERVVLLRGEGHQLSYKFLQRMDWGTWYSQRRATDGEAVMVPLNYYVQNEFGIVPEGWSAKLTLSADRRLIKEKSAHRPVFVKRSSDADKEKRAAYLQELGLVMDLLVMRIPSFHTDSLVSHSRGCSFGGVQLNNDKVAGVLSRDIEALLPFAQEVYNTALAKRMYDTDEYWIIRQGGWQGTSGAVAAPLNADAFRRSLKTALIKHSGLAKQSDSVALPQFPTSLPRKYHY